MLNKSVFTVSLLFFCLSLFGQDQLRKELKKIIKYDTEISYKDTPGFIVHIVDHSDSYTRSFGHTIASDKDTITETDVFELGSVSKIFTAFLFQILEEKGSLSLEDKVNTYLPVNYRNESLDHLTLNDLLLHLSKFPKRPSNFGKKEKDISRPYSAYTKDDLLDFYKNFNAKGNDNIEVASYSHINYALLEIVAEQVTNKLFSTLIEEEIFTPNDMYTAGFGQKDSNLIAGYTKTRRASTPWTFSSFEASEGMYGSVTDLHNFFSNYFAAKDDFPISAMESTLSAHAKTKYNKNFLSGKGWQIIHGKSPFDIYAMTGVTNGHSAFVAMVNETKTAVFVLSNSASGTHDLGMSILRMINNNWNRKASDE